MTEFVLSSLTIAQLAEAIEAGNTAATMGTLFLRAGVDSWEPDSPSNKLDRATTLLKNLRADNSKEANAGALEVARLMLERGKGTATAWSEPEPSPWWADLRTAVAGDGWEFEPDTDRLVPTVPAVQVTEEVTWIEANLRQRGWTTAAGHYVQAVDAFAAGNWASANSQLRTFFEAVIRDAGVLKNPRYTGYQVWARQRKDEVLLDIDDVAAGHVTKQRWNPEDEWQWSREPAHEALISKNDWQAVQDEFTAGTRRSAPSRRRTHDYMLKGMITCSSCGRKLVANVVRGRLQYRCRMKDEYPGIDHPRSLSVREDQLLPTIDRWLAQLFDEHHIDATVSSLANVETNDINTAEEMAARRTIKECDKRIANFETALGVTDDADTIAGFARQIERTRAERKNAELRLRKLTTGKGLTEDEIRAVVRNLADAVALLSAASPEDRRRVYEAAQLEVLYDHEGRRAKLSVAPRVTGGVGGGT